MLYRFDEDEVTEDADESIFFKSQHDDLLSEVVISPGLAPPYQWTPAAFCCYSINL